MALARWLRSALDTRPAAQTPPARRLSFEQLEDRTAPAFGTGGVAITDLAPGAGDWAESVALQADGKIVVAGSAGLARYTAGGSLDTSFNANGAQPGTITGSGYFNDVAVQADGKIVAGGFVVENGEKDFLLRRFLADGTPDPSFGSGGAVKTGFKPGGHDEIYAIAIQADGKVVAVGQINASKGEWAVARYNANGTLDKTFDRDGWVATSFKYKTTGNVPRAVAIQSDGRIVVAGNTVDGNGTADFAAARYNANGTLDTAFGGGTIQIDFGSEHGRASSSDQAYDLALQSDGKIVLAGGSNSANGGRFGLARLNANGSLDTTFAGDGKLILDTPLGESGGKWFTGIALQPDGKIVAVSYGSAFVYVARLSTDGSLDTSFDDDGWKYFDYAAPDSDTSRGSDVLIQPDGKIVIAGASGEEGNLDFALARFNPDGSFDSVL